MVQFSYVQGIASAYLCFINEKKKVLSIIIKTIKNEYYENFKIIFGNESFCPVSCYRGCYSCDFGSVIWRVVSRQSLVVSQNSEI